MANVPNTTTSGQVLTSVGDGSNASKWAVFSGSGSTLPTGTSTGQMIWWNGTAWIVTSTTGLATNYVMTWNGTAWVPAAGGNTLGGYAVNVSALNPTTDTGAMLTFNYNSSTGLSQWVETYVPTGTGSMFFWNGTNWESTSTTGIATGNVLVWNSTTSKWTPGGLTLAGDVTGSSGANTVVKIQNYPVNVTGIGNGDLLYWSNTGTSQWLVGPNPTTTGHYYSWNTGLGGHWELILANPGGASSNQGWTSTSIIPSSGTLPITSAGKIVEVTGITGFSSYLIGFNITAKNGDATTGHNLNAFIYQSGSSVAQSQQFMVNNQIGSTTVSYIATGLSSSTTYSFAGYAYSGGATTGTVNFATITVLGIA